MDFSEHLLEENRNVRAIGGTLGGEELYWGPPPSQQRGRLSVSAPVALLQLPELIPPGWDFLD